MRHVWSCVCACHFNLWTSWFLWNSVGAFCHFSIFQHHVFRFLQSGIKTGQKTCEVGSRLYEFWLEKAQLRPFANSIQANLKQTFVITLKENLRFSVMPMPVHRVNKKCWKQIFGKGMLVATSHFLFNISSVDSFVYLILVGK
jgi:hypothetical protein